MEPRPDRYKIPTALRELVMVDMLELGGSTVGAASLLQCSQPNISRRYRKLADELHLERDRSQLPGLRYGNSEWLRLLRHGVNCHRLACGVLRVGGMAGCAGDLQSMDCVQWIPLAPALMQHWRALLEQSLLDAVLLSEDRRSPPLLLCRSSPLVLETARHQGLVVEVAGDG